MKKRADTIPEKSMFAEGNVTVNVGSGLDTVEEETLSRNPPQGENKLTTSRDLLL